MYQYSEYPAWVLNAKRCLNWFIDTMGHEDWSKRRSEVVSYSNAISINSLNGNPISHDATSQPSDYHPLAVYDDWIGWYMYLVECLADRPTCDEPMQSARIYPFFAAIGRHINLLKNTHGIEDRLVELLSAKQNQPDSTLFELIVAACYCKNGWKVTFIKEQPPSKTPDFQASRGQETLYIECKRFSKVTDYAERERQAWLKRWRILSQAFTANQPSSHIKVVFKKPVNETELDLLAKLLASAGDLNEKSTFSIENEHVSFSVEKINMDAVNAHFSDYDVRCASPQLIELLSGSYSPFRNYTQRITPESILKYGEDDGLHAFNSFFGGIKHALSAEWKSISEDATTAKAKDVKKMLSKAVSQLPDDLPSVVHIGYETLSGPVVEFARHDKTMDTIRNFDYGSKNIQIIFLNALQCAPSTVELLECAETALIYRRSGGLDPDKILTNMLLLDQDDTDTAKTTHWQQDHDTEEFLKAGSA